MSQWTLMILSGIPGSGKSSLSKQLQERSEKVTNALLWNYIHLEYDKLLPPEVERELIENDSLENSSPWRHYREGIILCVDTLLSRLKSSELETSVKVESNPDNVSDALWATFIAMVTPGLDLHRQGHSICLMIDDNMYYRSMRYRYYQLARKYEIGFCQVQIQCNVMTASSRNSLRDVPVKTEVIQEMAQKMEVPDPTRFPWERYSLLLEHVKDFEKIYKLLDEAASDPVKPLPDVDEELQALARVVCSENFIHQADQILRKLISEEMLLAKDKNLQRKDLRLLAETGQTRRKHILGRLKSGEITVTKDLVDMAADASKDTNSSVYIFVKDLFRSGIT